jgi:hypothetical protein
MPFALFHFDRAAVFSVIANIVSTPVITLVTTPAAAAAAVAAIVGLDEPFLGVMGWSLEIVLAIGRWSVEASPAVDLPRMTLAGLVWAAMAIAIFCMANGRGRALALVPFGAMLAAWLSGPQPVGYVANDGSVFLKDTAGWLEITDWRADNGLNPLIIGDEIAKSPCPGKGLGCTLDLPSGRFAVAPDAGAARDGCPAAAALTFATRPGSDPEAIQPCVYVGEGGAVLELTGDRLNIRTAQKQSGRAWTQPLYEVVDRGR